MPRGGARSGAGRKPSAGGKPGPGRPPKRKIYEGPVVAAEDKIRDRLPELLDVALELAIENKSEKMVIYCIDRALGKPTQPVDLVNALRILALERGHDPDKVIRFLDHLKKLKAV